MNRKFLEDIWQQAAYKMWEVCLNECTGGDYKAVKSADTPPFELPYLDGAEELVGFIDEMDLTSVQNMQKPLTKEGAAWLLSRYSKELIMDVLLAMENHKGLNRKYQDAKLTAYNWCRIRLKDSSPQNKRKSKYKEFD